MSQLIIIAVAAAACIAVGVFAGLSIVYVFNRIPAQWLCDYGEKPSQELTDPNVKRMKENPWRWLFAVILASMCLRLFLSNFIEGVGIIGGSSGPTDVFVGFISGESLVSAIQMTVSGLIASWASLIIAAADKKYMIIPDQFVVVLVIAAIGMAKVFSDTTSFLGIDGFWQPAAGLLVGGGFMLLVAGTGALMKKEVLGFGDVKLCAAAGVLLGAEGIFIVMIGASLISGVVAGIGLISGRYKKDDVIPLGSYLCACIIAYIFIAWPLTYSI